ncbi:hypothetical protein Poli38472_011592 [Pythium oligandrum]|uniref:Uncharacterized protein n=1 Tax=Pythium oligandrum TaxID=41045 RepID=A0A8K1FMC1_PYTOL|nr:hypothetical protein Poli38472_011592 [Pythium oligandrum]|eukprot:TMW64712.1 hypothetical protein Poli38472_011592 [Pythium oligandrum]
MVSQNTILECGSDSLRVYLVYSQPNDELPEWLTALASQLILIRFVFSAAHVQERAQQAIVEARHEASRLMEIRTLRLDLIACDEQIETMENEMLDFFSVEDPVLVFSDTTKALKIVGNRSALHTLESSKNDSIIKIHQHLLYFARYDVIVQRIIDVALTLRYIEALPSVESTHFSVERLWPWVGLALRHTSSTSSAAEVVAIMTVFARQSIQASESEALVQLFEFILAFNVYSRREMTLTSLLPLEAQRKIATTVNPTPEYELLARLVMLLQCDDDAPTLKKVCAAVTSKLLVLRPECIASHHWRALCYLAEKVPPLRTLITQLSEASKQNREVWRENLDLAHIDSSEGSSWQPAAVCDGVMRVCIIAALNRRWVLREIDTFAARELTWAGDFEVEEELEVPLTQDEEKTGESLMTKMATALDAVVRATMHASPMPHSLKELWKNYSKTNKPIVVVCYPATDFLRELTELASDVVTTVDMSCNEASSVEAFEKQLVVAIQKGHWVALVNLDSKPQWRNCIARILADTSKYEVHSDFRLWISLLVSPNIQQPLSEPTEGVQKCLNPRYAFFRSLAHVITLAKQHRIINTQLQPENEFLHQPLKRLVVFHAALASSDMFAFSLWKQHAGVHDDRFLMALNALAQVTPQEDSGKPRTTCTVWDSIQITVLNVYGADVTTIQDRLLLSCCVDLLFHAEAIDPVLMEAITKTAVDVAQVIKQFDAMSWPSICENAHTFWSRGMSTTVESVAISQRQQLLARLHQILEYHGAFMLSPRGGKMSVVEGSKAARATAGGSGTGPQAGGSIGLALDAITRFATELDGISFGERELDERYPRDYKRPLHQILRHEITQMQQIQRSIREDITVIQAGLFGQEPLRQAISIAFAQIVQGVTPSPWLSLLQPHSHSEVVQLESFRTTVLARLRYFSTWLEKGRPSRLELDKFQSCEAVFQVIHQHFVRNLVGTTVCGVDCLKVQRIFEDRQHVSLPARDETFYLAGVRLFGNLQAEILSGSVSVSHAAAILERKRSQMPQTTRDPSEIRVDGTPVILEVTASCLSSQPKAPDSIGSARHLVPPAPSSPRRSSTNPAWSGYLCPIFRSSACTSSKFESLPVLGRLGSVEANTTIVSGMSLPELTLSGTVLVIDSVDRDGL